MYTARVSAVGEMTVKLATHDPERAREWVMQRVDDEHGAGGEAIGTVHDAKNQLVFEYGSALSGPRVIRYDGEVYGYL